jgi:hypothetical protein
VNSVCYLSQQTVQLITFVVNYVGPPFNTPLSENKGMRVSLTYSSGFLAVLVSQLHAPLNERWARLTPCSCCRPHWHWPEHPGQAGLGCGCTAPGVLGAPPAAPSNACARQAGGRRPRHSPGGAPGPAAAPAGLLAR